MELGMLGKTMALLVVVIGLAACSPEPGSKAWCKNMDEKPAGDWSANEAAEYAMSCAFNTSE
jgi:hypothetical protein